MRTFVALNLPADTRSGLRDALAPLRERQLPVRWVDADNVHLTMKFLGEIEPAHVEPLGAALDAVAAKHESVTLRLGGFGAFPSLRRANVLWIGIEPEPRLLALHRDLETALFSLGYPREPRPFRPHLTAARTRGGARAPDVTRLVDTFNFRRTVTVDTLDLMRSHLGADGSRYEPLRKARLGKVET